MYNGNGITNPALFVFPRKKKKKKIAAISKTVKGLFCAPWHAML